MDRAAKKSLSIVGLVLELAEQSVALVFLELNLAALELRGNVSSARGGVVMPAVGGLLLLFSMLGVMATSIAVLAMVLPVWLSALVVTGSLILSGALVFIIGLGKLKQFTLRPKYSIERVDGIFKKLKLHAEQRQGESATAKEEISKEVK